MVGWVDMDGYSYWYLILYNWFLYFIKKGKEKKKIRKKIRKSDKEKKGEERRKKVATDRRTYKKNEISWEAITKSCEWSLDIYADGW